MNFNWKSDDYHPTPFLYAAQIILLIMIIAGIWLIATRDTWVPKLVDRIIQSETMGVTDILPTTTTPPARAGNVATGVEGIVTIGPTCPVQRVPADPNCADKTYQTTLVLANTITGRNGGILIRTDSKGYFSRELTPGTYTIRAQQGGTLPRLAPVSFEVKQGKRVSLNLHFDSGIR